MENKALFVQALQAAFIAGDPERYGHLSEKNVTYEKFSGVETLMQVDGPQVNITGCSCSAIAEAFVKNYL